MGSIIALNWARSGPIIIEMRKTLGRQGARRDVEWLIDELHKLNT
jgi:hypothetical protein